MAGWKKPSLLALYGSYLAPFSALSETFFFFKPLLASLNYNDLLDVFFSICKLGGVMEGIPIHVSFSASEGISPEILSLSCVPSVFFGTSLLTNVW